MSKENPNRGKPIPDLKVGDVVFVNNGDIESMSRIQILKEYIESNNHWKTFEGWYVRNDGCSVAFQILRKIHIKE